MAFRKILALSCFCTIFVSIAGFNLYTGGNSWALDLAGQANNNYTFNSLPAKFSTYFYTNSNETQFTLSIQMDVNVPVIVKVTVGDISHTVNIPANSDFSVVNVGKYIATPGYQNIITQILSLKSGKGKVMNFIVSDNLSDLYYIKNINQQNPRRFYWGRRGNSPSIRPIIKNANNIQYYYSQVTVPIGFDTKGVYWMANGFGQGYFGMQVNSPTQRRILFSVWSPFSTNDPKLIPLQDKIVANRIGPNVVNKQFGNQGSGGQTFLRFNWKAGVTYKFLIKAKPLETNATTFTAWFNDPDNATNNGWRLIAELTRPKTKTYLTSLYSFLQCFLGDSGNQTSIGHYGNQWYYDSSKQWKEVTSVEVTHPGDAKNKGRRDMEIGVTISNDFFVKINGFFNTTTERNTVWTRKPNGQVPKINLATLP